MMMTDLAVRALQPPPKGQKTYWSKDLAGFGIRISQGGAKTFIVLDPRSAIRTQQTIGRYPVIDLKAARQEAKRRLAEAVLGKGQTRSVGWNTALQTYLAEVAEKRKPRTHADYKRLLEKHFRFGDTKLSDITPAMIDGKISKLSSTPAEQQHAFVVLRAFTKWCYRKSYIDRNPMDRMEEPKGYEARERVLTDDELRKVWLALEDTTFGKIVKLLILTGQRETEIAHLTPTMIIILRTPGYSQALTIRRHHRRRIKSSIPTKIRASVSRFTGNRYVTPGKKLSETLCVVSGSTRPRCVG